jgi:hypothetical protein
VDQRIYEVTPNCQEAPQRRKHSGSASAPGFASLQKEEACTMQKQSGYLLASGFYMLFKISHNKEIKRRITLSIKYYSIRRVFTIHTQQREENDYCKFHYILYYTTYILLFIYHSHTTKRHTTNYLSDGSSLDNSPCWLALAAYNLHISVPFDDPWVVFRFFVPPHG